jgi:hypothetical protein
MDPAFQQQAEALQRAIEGAMNAVDSSKLRPLQKSTFLKLAECVNQTQSRDEINSCIERTQHALAVAQNVVDREGQVFQERFSRCMMECQESVKDKEFKARDAAEKYYFSCARGCVDKSMALVKVTQARMEKEIDEKLKQLK